MYVCSCRALNERKVRAAVENGAKSACDVFKAHGVKPKCGTCVRFMESAVQDARGLNTRAA